MTLFTYTGTTKSGEKITETVEAIDRYAVYEIARTNGHVVSGISEKKGFSLKGIINTEKIDQLISRVKSDELVTMTRNLSSMITAGLPLTRALSVIERQSSNPKLKFTLKSIREDINKGQTFHDSLEKFPKVFSNLYIAMVRAGEESGQLSGALKILALQMERSSTLKKKIKGAMIYPLIVITIMLIIGAVMMIYVVPSITGTFTKMNITLPMTTKILIATSDFMSQHTILVLGGIAGFIFGFIYLLKTHIGKKVFHYLFVKIPVIGPIVKEVNSARTARTLSSLLSSGVAVLSAITITRDVVQNIYYKAVLDEAAERVEKGTVLSEVFIEHNDLYPVLVGEMILVGEETGQISGMLEQLATFYETEVDQKTKDLSTIIEPLLMVFIGGAVGFFALAMISPIYSISDSIG
jgi:type II secretory pathway component PulF